MKALKSDLAKKVLADPQARERLRELAAGEFRTQAPRVAVWRDSNGRARRLTATVVPKAA